MQSSETAGFEDAMVDSSPGTLHANNASPSMHRKTSSQMELSSPEEQIRPVDEILSATASLGQ